MSELIFGDPKSIAQKELYPKENNSQYGTRPRNIDKGTPLPFDEFPPLIFPHKVCDCAWCEKKAKK